MFMFVIQTYKQNITYYIMEEYKFNVKPEEHQPSGIADFSTHLHL
jgi:hypothetical protein